MSLILGIGAVGAVGAVYLGRKGWLAFHRVVGISPGTVAHQPESTGFQPKLIQVNLSESQIQPLPDIAKQHLQRIDDKADTYQQWRDAIDQKHFATIQNNIQSTVQSNQTHSDNQPRTSVHASVASALHPYMTSPIASTEDHFVLSKMLNEHLPEIVDSYLNIIQRKSRLHNNHSNIHPSVTSTIHSNGHTPSMSQDKALDMLLELMGDIERRLDKLLHDCENYDLQNLEVMRRYLNNRD